MQAGGQEFESPSPPKNEFEYNDNKFCARSFAKLNRYNMLGKRVYCTLKTSYKLMNNILKEYLTIKTYEKQNQVVNNKKVPCY